MRFDLDGTLVEAAAEICDAANDALQGAGYPAVTLAQVQHWMVRPRALPYGDNQGLA
jgi:phosphoglycolate phosphatase-like HAD superfamily hydrolase